MTWRHPGDPMANFAVAAAIGVSHVSVSRYRSGLRTPKIGTMVKIAKAYGWPVADQATAAAKGKYAEGLERALRRASRRRRKSAA